MKFVYGRAHNDGRVRGHAGGAAEVWMDRGGGGMGADHLRFTASMWHWAALSGK